MGRLTYTANLTNTYTKAYNKGFKDGKIAAYNFTIQTCLETATLIFVDAGWSQEDIQEWADRFTRGVIYNSKHPEEWKQILKEAEEEHGFIINFDANDEVNIIK